MFERKHQKFPAIQYPIKTNPIKAQHYWEYWNADPLDKSIVPSHLTKPPNAVSPFTSYGPCIGRSCDHHAVKSINSTLIRFVITPRNTMAFHRSAISTSSLGRPELCGCDDRLEPTPSTACCSSDFAGSRDDDDCGV
jgi:hypothetical protein